MKAQLENELLNALLPYINQSDIDDVRMRITMVMGKYEIKEEVFALTVWEGDINEQILKKFIIAKIAKGCSKRTVKYYKQTITWFFNYIKKPYSEVTADDIRLYLALRVQRDGVAKSTANNEKRNLSSFYTWLQKEEILLKNPMNKVESIRESKKKKKAFELEDVERIRMGCRSNYDKAILEVLASTWARISEVAQIKISDINGNKVLVHGKGDKDREVFLNARARLAIEEYLKERSDKSPYLFPKCKYKVTEKSFKKRKGSNYDMQHWYMDPEMVSEEPHMDPSGLESRMRKAGRRAGVEKCHPHRFRRTGATIALRQGMPIHVVSKLLGHESIETTQIYLDISDKELEQAHEKYVI